jgi:hypothetical protein
MQSGGQEVLKAGEVKKVNEIVIKDNMNAERERRRMVIGKTCFVFK